MKYGKIWIWSILAAAVAALSTRSVASLVIMQLNNFSGYGAHSRLAASFFFRSLAVIVPSAAVVVSVWYLLLFLRHYILPILFPAPPSTEPPVNVPDGATLLYRAFAAVVIAIAADLAIAISSAIYGATT
jgi:hypothetical protein